MFTGIITQQARVESMLGSGADMRINFALNSDFLNGTVVGDSIAVSGVCLTVIDVSRRQFSADVSGETLERTTLGRWTKGRMVNMEQSLRAQDRLGGHLVSGHVDACATLVSETPVGGCRRLEFELPNELARFVPQKGSVCIDGVSLTVNEIGKNEAGQSWFCVNVIPHTFEVTTLGSLRTGDTVNLEVDMIARYLERLQAGT